MIFSFNSLFSDLFIEKIFIFVLILLIFLIFFQNDQTQKKSLKFNTSVSDNNILEKSTFFIFIFYIFLSLIRIKFS
jgi:preprotein translocase subunit SecG